MMTSAMHFLFALSVLRLAALLLCCSSPIPRLAQLEVRGLENEIIVRIDTEEHYDFATVSIDMSHDGRSVILEEGENMLINGDVVYHYRIFTDTYNTTVPLAQVYALRVSGSGKPPIRLKSERHQLHLSEMK